jgi:hypothetical protein
MSCLFLIKADKGLERLLLKILFQDGTLFALTASRTNYQEMHRCLLKFFRLHHAYGHSPGASEFRAYSTRHLFPLARPKMYNEPAGAGYILYFRMKTGSCLGMGSDSVVAAVQITFLEI